MTSLLETLPPELLQKILVLASAWSDPLTLLRCEATSRTLRQAVANDALWEHWWGIDHGLWHDSRLESDRMCACVDRKLTVIRVEQKCPANILVDVLGIDGLHDLLRFAIGLIPGLDLVHDVFFFRRDTLFVLAELLQAHMIGELCRANIFCCAVAEAIGQYPILTANEFNKSFQLQSVTTEISKASPMLDESFVLRSMNLGVPETTRDRIIRHLSHRAGVVRMSNQAYQVAWGKLTQTVVALLQPAVVELLSSKEAGPDNSENEKVVLAPGQTMDMIPPRPSLDFCEDCGETGYIHTPVPRQIEDAARSLGMIHRVYGNAWLADDDNDWLAEDTNDWLDEEVADAESEYVFQVDVEMNDQDSDDETRLDDYLEDIDDAMSFDLSDFSTCS